MEKLEKLDDALYIAQYGLPKKGNYQEIWDKIKSDNEILKWAIKVKKDKFGERDIVNGLAICDSMLVDYGSIDKAIYQELVNTIYSNTQVARIVQDGASNGGYSYLLMTLWNHGLVLTDEQKAFALDEAMNKIGTKRYYDALKNRSSELDKFGISNECVTVIDIDGYKNPIGLKSYYEYFDYIFNSLSDTQAHGNGEFDIRYCILRNPNWSIEEKKKLLYDFYPDDDVYDEILEQWEWGIVNDKANFHGQCISQFDKYELYEYSYEELFEFYKGDKNTTDRIYAEIQFCKTMHQLRPQQWELEITQVESSKTVRMKLGK